MAASFLWWAKQKFTWNFSKYIMWQKNQAARRGRTTRAVWHLVASLIHSFFLSFNQEALWYQNFWWTKKKKKKENMQHMQGFKNSEDILIIVCFYLSHCTEWFTVSSPQTEKKSVFWFGAALWAFNSWRNSNHLVLSSRAPAAFLLTDFRLPMWCHCADPCFLQQPSHPWLSGGLARVTNL